MTIYNLGSINADHVYRVPHLPGPGETLAARSLQSGLGGKGANMSVAAARAGAHVAHIGAIGPDGRWARDRLMEYGVDTRHIENETNAQVKAAEIGSKLGFRVCYAAAPFSADAVQAIVEHLDLLILNEVEAEQLSTALNVPIEALRVTDIVVTLGARGSRWIHTPTGQVRDTPALPVTPVDTTGAGDTFTGFLLAGLDPSCGAPYCKDCKACVIGPILSIGHRGQSQIEGREHSVGILNLCNDALPRPRRRA